MNERGAGDEVGYNVEFIFDCDVGVAITIYYFATEEVEMRRVRLVFRNMNKSYNIKIDRTYVFVLMKHFALGINQK